jgi:hypothetical protein
MENQLNLNGLTFNAIFNIINNLMIFFAYELLTRVIIFVNLKNLT